MTRIRRLPTSLATATIFFLCAVSSLAQPDRVHREETDVTLVEVPVQVVRDGHPVRGLHRDDFVLYDGKARQRIAGFDVVDLARAGAPDRGSAAVPLSGRRHFLFLFDLSFSDPASIVQAREGAKRVVREALHPTDLAAVASYTRSRGPRLSLGFTSDRRQVELAIDRLGAPELIAQSVDPTGLTFGDLENAENTLAIPVPLGGASEDPRAGSVRNRLKALVEFINENRRLQVLDLSQQAALADTERRRNEALDLTRSLADLARLMAGVEGRKYVVYLSEGFDSSLLFADSDQRGQKLMSDAAETGDLWRIDSDQRFGSARGQAEMHDMIDAFRRADCVIEAVDVGRLRAASDVGASNRFAAQGAAVGENSLFTMADGTGGELYRNFNDLFEAMGRMLESTSLTYVLAFQPHHLVADGSYHRLRVELRDPAGARVVHRPGYYAPLPFARRSPLERQMAAAGALMSGTGGGSVGVDVLAVPFPATGHPDQVAVVVEADGPALLRDLMGDALPLEVYGYAVDGEGRIRDYFAQPVGVRLQEARGRMESAGLKFYGHLELPPGDYSLRVLVRNIQTGHYGLRAAELKAPGPSTREPRLLPPLFPDRIERWVFARQQEAGEADAGPYPFVIGSQAFVPAALPRLTPSQPADVALVAYYLPDISGLTGRIRVETPEGREVGDAGLGALQLLESTGSSPTRFVARFVPPSLPPGTYQLRVELSAPRSGLKIASEIPFEVAQR